MTDTNKYRVWFSNKNFCNKNYKNFDTRIDLVNWLCTNETLQFVRITFNNKSGGPGRTGWVGGKTMLGLWQEVDRERKKKSIKPLPE